MVLHIEIFHRDKKTSSHRTLAHKAAIFLGYAYHHFNRNKPTAYT